MMNKNLKPHIVVLALITTLGLFYYISKASVIDNSDPTQTGFIDTTEILNLKGKLRNKPTSTNLWNALGREYMLKQNFEKAYQAFNESRQVDFSALFQSYESNSQTAIENETRMERLKWLTGLAEARVLAQSGAIDEESEKLLNLALALDPDHPKGLWYGGLNAAQKGQYQLAKTYWEQLETQNPPGSLGQVLRQRLESLDQVLANTQALASDMPLSKNIKIDDWVLKLKLKVNPELRNSAQEETRVFLSLRQDPSMPPLAAKQLLLKDIEQTVQLSSLDSITAMGSVQKANWDKQLRLDIIWSPNGKVDANGNIRFASLLNRDNLSGVNEFVLDQSAAIK